MESKEYGVQISEFCLDRTSLYSPAYEELVFKWAQRRRQNQGRQNNEYEYEQNRTVEDHQGL